ncbi:E3 ubiquitin-protein ligase MYLIP [Thelohanellus kitauei]|uniref:E3 ubiquitin-protein ligase MYLIP n=1 Tax=Thelohanellus kitauei TaxID=669202 RepID=A0A0C2MT98_THEKT|nr:E3 ubiquitin-protein ligase MYLIP [Thelohanellus kitauei]
MKNTNFCDITHRGRVDKRNDPNIKISIDFEHKNLDDVEQLEHLEMELKKQFTGKQVSQTIRYVEGQVLRSELQCGICLENDINCTFCPCGHTMSCMGCSELCKVCPICRSSIHYLQKVYLS